MERAGKGEVQDCWEKLSGICYLGAMCVRSSASWPRNCSCFMLQRWLCIFPAS